jgi:hypothetical protein
MQIVAQRLGKPVGGLLFGRGDGWLWGAIIRWVVFIRCHNGWSCAG